MNNHKKHLLAIFFFSFFISQMASAIASLQLEFGRRSGKEKMASDTSESVTGTEISVSAYLDPIPLVPVGFGLNYAMDTYSVTMAKHNLSELKGYTLAPEITAWLPLLDIKPFIKLGYILLGAYTGKSDYTVLSTTTSYDLLYQSSGLRYSAGLKYSPVPLVSLLLEFNLANEKVKPHEIKIGGVDLTSSLTSYDFNSTAILLGVEVGI